MGEPLRIIGLTTTYVAWYFYILEKSFQVVTWSVGFVLDITVTEVQSIDTELLCAVTSTQHERNQRTRRGQTRPPFAFVITGRLGNDFLENPTNLLTRREGLLSYFDLSTYRDSGFLLFLLINFFFFFFLVSLIFLIFRLNLLLFGPFFRVSVLILIALL